LKKILTSYLLWGGILFGFIAIILWDDGLENKIKQAYVKQKMRMENVHFSQMDNGFEFARLYADFVDMDDHQSNMIASNVRTIFFKKDVATFTGLLLSNQANKSPFEAIFWGNVRGHTTEGESVKTEEFRYFLRRKELFTQKPVTIWKGNAIITGKGLRYKTQTKEAQILQQVKIRIWDEPATGTAKISSSSSEIAKPVKVLPIAPPPSELLVPLKKMTRPVLVASDTVSNKDNKKYEK